ncbi:MAG: hypothetical protein LBH13_08745 [Cellulomonadaceae bacterium]|jgi:hypothetical protein|nr:hypothetical protein [Cellulomonadaceae bacterium]
MTFRVIPTVPMVSSRHVCMGTMFRFAVRIENAGTARHSILVFLARTQDAWNLVMSAHTNGGSMWGMTQDAGVVTKRGLGSGTATVFMALNSTGAIVLVSPADLRANHVLWHSVGWSPMLTLRVPILLSVMSNRWTSIAKGLAESQPTPMQQRSTGGQGREHCPCSTLPP